MRLAVTLNHSWTSGTRDFDTSGTTVYTPALQNYNNNDHLDSPRLFPLLQSS